MKVTPIPVLLLSVAFLGGCSERNATTAPTASAALQPPLSASITSPRQFDGDGHPNVGLLFIDFSGDHELQPATEATCSGFLIAQTVFLTAAHCFVLNHVAPGTALWVSFDLVWLPAPAHVIQATGFAVDPEFNVDARRGGGLPDQLAWRRGGGGQRARRHLAAGYAGGEKLLAILCDAVLGTSEVEREPYGRAGFGPLTDSLPGAHRTC